MPIYEYECRECGHRFEVRQSVQDDPITECEVCSGPVRKVYYPVGIIYKVGGFHITDYVRKNTGSSDGKGDGAKKESKEKETSSSESTSSSD
jgi:putative FmdB family regulatory protein